MSLDFISINEGPLLALAFLVTLLGYNRDDNGEMITGGLGCPAEGSELNLIGKREPLHVRVLSF